MALQVVDVWNMACDLLTEAAIEDVDEDTRIARIFSRHYENVRKKEMKARWWKFALQTDFAVASDQTAEDLVFKYHYSDPDGALRVLFEALTRDGTLDGQPINATPTQGGFWTDFAGPLDIRFIDDIEDPDEWDANFVEIMAASLALRAAQALTDKISSIKVASDARAAALQEAYRTNAIVVAGRRSTAGQSLAEARGDFRMWYRPAS